MGTICFQHYNRATKDIVKDDLECSNEHGTWRVVDMSQRGSTVFSVIERTGGDAGQAYIPDQDGTYRFIVVTLTSRRSGEICIKHVDEHMGPYEIGCPKRLIERASPLGPKSNYAQKWRERNAASLTRKGMRQLKEGDTIQFKEPVYFDGEPYDTFTVTTYYSRGKERKCFRRMDGVLCRIGGLNDRDFAVNP